MEKVKLYYLLLKEALVNKIVFLLPVSAMLLLFYFGYLYITNEEPITNESLQNEIKIEIDSQRSANGMLIKGIWDWTAMPIDGMVGDDYITIVIQSEDGTPIPNERMISSEISLLKGDTVLESYEGIIHENGVIFSFPNKLIEHESYGNRGKLELELDLENMEGEHIVAISYVHTWAKHDLLLIEDIVAIEASLEERIANHYWRIQRFFSIKL